ncbi:MAG: hypothetical protein LRZ85_05115 [Alphaproteobacteria bacterium]|nr:hypothetical protein [Alphaproteobacteria bacterium]
MIISGQFIPDIHFMTHLITPVVLAGGKGTCLWPLTSRKRPKPFLRPFSRNSLYQETLIRVQSFAPPVVITEEYNLAIAHREAQEMGVTPLFSSGAGGARHRSRFNPRSPQPSET